MRKNEKSSKDKGPSMTSNVGIAGGAGRLPHYVLKLLFMTQMTPRALVASRAPFHTDTLDDTSGSLPHTNVVALQVGSDRRCVRLDASHIERTLNDVPSSDAGQVVPVSYTHLTLPTNREV